MPSMKDSNNKKAAINSGTRVLIASQLIKIARGVKNVESNTKGIFIVGCGQGPKDISESVSQASGAAAKINTLFSKAKLENDPTVAYVESELCKACGVCVEACPYDARELDVRKGIASVNESLCQGCGACVVACPNKACQLRNLTTEQILAMIEGLE